jgi:hypothetical protein
MRLIHCSCAAFIFGSVSLSTAFASPLVAATTPVPVETNRFGWITAKIDATACSQQDPACEGFPRGPAVAGNANPVRLVVQLEGFRPSEALAPTAFDLRTQVAPSEAAPVTVASCPACFEAQPGQTYVLWLVPSAETWRTGGYYLRVGVASNPTLAPALVRLDIPGVPPRPANQPPEAAIVASPPGEQGSFRSVVFDGTGSRDPDPGDFITMYRWAVISTNPDFGHPNPVIVEGAAASSVSFPSDTLAAFQNVQDLIVTLSVTDDPQAPAQVAAGQPVAYRSQATIRYSIVPIICSTNTAPTAVLSGPPIQSVFGFPQSLVSFVLDGSLSSDTETPIDVYNFNCGNGTTPPSSTSPAKAVCRYLVDAVPHTFTATLRVVDRGTGQIVNGSYECSKDSSPVSIQVVVSPLAQ